MTGGELLLKLMALSQTDLAKPVYMEGCDCYGVCEDVYVDSQEINLNRSYDTWKRED